MRAILLRLHHKIVEQLDQTYRIWVDRRNAARRMILAEIAVGVTGPLKSCSLRISPIRRYERGEEVIGR